MPFICLVAPQASTQDNFPWKCQSVKLKDGGDAVSDRNRFNRQFSLNDPLTRFVRKSQRQYSILALLTNYYLVLIRLLKSSYLAIVCIPCFQFNGVYRSAYCGASWVLFGTPRHPSHHDWLHYFLSYSQIIGPWPMTVAKRKPCHVSYLTHDRSMSH